MATTSSTPHLESQVLHEYSRLSSNLDSLARLTAKLSTAQPALLEQLRPLERKLGMVLTLYQASIWAILVQREGEEELADQHHQQQQEHQHQGYAGYDDNSEDGDVTARF
ncbi:hypothetical protein MNV49_000202 [Pseudohyphozyma bogoriensis]|nr:hypothetical protein MNV49_000202 [Pseudohyphozyma bogoriensis]